MEGEGDFGNSVLFCGWGCGERKTGIKEKKVVGNGFSVGEEGGEWAFGGARRIVTTTTFFFSIFQLQTWIIRWTWADTHRHQPPLLKACWSSNMAGVEAPVQPCCSRCHRLPPQLCHVYVHTNLLRPPRQPRTCCIFTRKQWHPDFRLWPHGIV